MILQRWVIDMWLCKILGHKFYITKKHGKTTYFLTCQRCGFDPDK